MTTYKKLLASASVMVLSVACGLVFGAQKAAAYTLVQGPGYFSGSTVSADADDVDASDVIGPRPAIPPYVYDGVGNDKQDYLTWLDGLVDQVSCASGRNEIGAAFIVNTMLKLPAASRTKCVTPAMWNTLYKNVMDADIGMTVTNYSAAQLATIGGGQTSFFSSNAGGDDFYDNWSYVFSRDVVHFYSKSTGKQLYYIEVPCANPMPANAPGIPDADLPPSLTFAVSCATLVVAGKAIDPNASDTEVDIAYSINGGSTWTSLTTNLLANPNFSYNLSASAAGDTYATIVRVIAHNYRENGTRDAVDDTTVTHSFGPCNKANCDPVGTSFPATMSVGTSTSFKVAFKLDLPWTSPPYTINTNPYIRVSIFDPNGILVTTASPSPTTNVPYSASGLNILSSNVTFTPALAGTYTMSYTLTGTGNASALNKSCGGEAGESAYQPFFAVKGGDVMAGTGVGNGTCTPPASPADIKSWNRGSANGYAGANSEVAGWATGTLQNFVSGMGLKGGVSPGYKLSFGNVAPSNIVATNYGGSFGASSLPCTPDYYSFVGGSTGVGSGFDPNSAPAGGGSYSGSGSPFVINATTLAAGKIVNLYVNGNVIIMGNITYGPYDATNVPRFNLYVKGDIYIDPNVTELHGVYSAQNSSPSTGGNIYTCASSVGSVGESYTDCNKQLRVIGSMTAQTRIFLSRTYGSLVASGPVPAAPGESFEYGPELWLGSKSANSTSLEAYINLAPVL